MAVTTQVRILVTAAHYFAVFLNARDMEHLTDEETTVAKWFAFSRLWSLKTDIVLPLLFFITARWSRGMILA